MKAGQSHSNGDHNPANGFENGDAPRPTETRVGRLLKEREIRKIIKSSSHSDAVENGTLKTPSAINNHQTSENDLNGPLRNSIPPSAAEFNGVGNFFDGISAGPAANTDRNGSPGKKPAVQRLLVVANRLPVSAIRRGEDAWSLEISAGGLVSALLGTCVHTQFDSIALPLLMALS